MELVPAVLGMGQHTLRHPSTRTEKGPSCSHRTGDSSSYLSMAARDTPVTSLGAFFPPQDSHLAWEHSHLELPTSLTAVPGTAKKSLLTISPYISPISMSPSVFQSHHWMLWGIIFLSRAKNTLLESDQISSIVKGKLNAISFPRAVSPSLEELSLSSCYRSNAGNNNHSMLLKAALKMTILPVKIKPPAKKKTFLPLSPRSCAAGFNDSAKTIYAAVFRLACKCDREAPACE